MLKLFVIMSRNTANTYVKIHFVTPYLIYVYLVLWDAPEVILKGTHIKILSSTQVEVPKYYLTCEFRLTSEISPAEN